VEAFFDACFCGVPSENLLVLRFASLVRDERNFLHAAQKIYFRDGS
jgi:hypothetical protein